MPTDDEVYAEDAARLARMREQSEQDDVRYQWRDARRGSERGESRRALAYIVLALTAFWGLVAALVWDRFA